MTLEFVPPREARAHFPEQRLVIEPTMEDKRTWDFLKARFRFARLATSTLTLSTCSMSTFVKKPFQVIVTKGSAPNDNFLIGFRFIPSSPPHPPGNVLAKKALFSTHFAQNSTLFRVVGKGVSSFTNITGKAPTLLTSIAVLSIQPFSPRPQGTLFTPKILHNHYFQILLDITAVPREIEDNGYAFFFSGRGEVNKVHYGLGENGD